MIVPARTPFAPNQHLPPVGDQCIGAFLFVSSAFLGCIHRPFQLAILRLAEGMGWGIATCRGARPLSPRGRIKLLGQFSPIPVAGLIMGACWGTNPAQTIGMVESDRPPR
jgi:hypothetical protein